jgi:hypothetical protein
MIARRARGRDPRRPGRTTRIGCQASAKSGTMHAMHYWGKSRTTTETIGRFGELAEHLGDPADAAKAWTDAGFDDEQTAKWLEARCFDPAAARELDDLSVTPAQAAKRTRDGKRDYLDTIAFKVSSGDLSPRQGAARASSSR